MGTSSSFSTPSGGKWTPVKTDISGFLSGGNVSPGQIAAGTLTAAGGLAVPSDGATSVEGRGGRGGAAGRGRARRQTSVSRTISGLGGFGASVGARGLTEALRTLGLEELRGRPAPEVVARIAEHLSDDAQGLQKELLTTALRDAIFDAAAIEGDLSYENLDASLQAYMNREGIEGLIELFLARYVFDRLWLLIENHADLRAETANSGDLLATAVQSACRAHVHAEMSEYRTNGQLARIDWFGRDGERIGRELVAALEARIAGTEAEARP
jgi:hypothetical protein